MSILIIRRIVLKKVNVKRLCGNFFSLQHTFIPNSKAWERARWYSIMNKDKVSK